MLRRPFRGAFCWCLIATALAFAPGAHAQQLHVDLDRDGVRDRVSIQHAPVSAVNVWLSSTQSRRQLRTVQPVLSIAAADLDGDGHPELFAADASAGLHAWRQVGHGRFRPIRPRARHPSVRSIVARIGDDDSDEAADTVDVRADSPARDARHTTLRPSLEIVGAPTIHGSRPHVPLFWTPSEPRAPPVFPF